MSIGRSAMMSSMKATFIRCAALVTVVVVLASFSGEAFGENRMYHLRVTLRSGKRYETISTFDPINYCHANGGSVIYLRDYSLIYSPEMKVRVLRTWIDRGGDLAERWRQVLRANHMLSNNNHKPLPDIEPLTSADMQRPD